MTTTCGYRPVGELDGDAALRVCAAFYGLAVAVVWGLIYVPYAEVVYFDRIDFRIAFFCLAGAGVVLNVVELIRPTSGSWLA